MTPRAVLLKIGLTPLNTVRPVNTAHPKPAVHSAKSMLHFSKQVQSTAQRPFYKQTTLTSKYVNTAMRHYYTKRPRAGKPLMDDKGFVDSRCSRHMTENIAYLSNFKEFDGGYVTFRGGAHGGRISGTQGEFNAGTSTQNKEISQDCIVMPIWKDASYFDSPSKDIGNGKPKSDEDDQKHVEDGPDNENDEKDKFEDYSSPKEVNAAGKHVNTVSPEVNTGHFKLNIVDPSVSVASSNDQNSPKDMFKLGASHTLETTHVEFFSDEDKPEVDLGNITNSYTVPPTPNTRIHKDHLITNVIGDVKSSIQTRRMTKSTSEKGFLSAVYEQKTHDTLNTCLYAYFLSQIDPTSIAKALSDSSWVEANARNDLSAIQTLTSLDTCGFSYWEEGH
ncbi:hypothetical protein Tco_0046167 [Tanacetum coccineum]